MSDRNRATPPIVIGWREPVALPEWGIARLKAKADTGARTSAIDVDRFELLPGDRVRFALVVDRDQPDRRIAIETAVVRTARVRSSLGIMHERPIVRTTMHLGGIDKTIEIGLVCRKNMLCRMLLGRKALSPEFHIDPSRRVVAGRTSGPGTRHREASRKRENP